MSKWISVESTYRPKLFDTVLGYTGDGVNDLNNACDYVSMYLDKDGFFHDGNDDIVDVTYWRKRVKPPSKDKKKRKWYSAEVCLPVPDAYVELHDDTGEFKLIRQEKTLWFWACCVNGECVRRKILQPTDKWRPAKVDNAN